jgi:hypothetical protein
MGPGITFIVRLYRSAASSVAGVVEDVRSGVRIPFTNPEELWKALSIKRRRQSARKRPKEDI